MNAEINHLKEISEWKVVNISFYNYKDLWYKEKVRNEILKINKINYIEHENDECRRIINYEILGVSLVDCTKK